jgi:hypothetical protein
MGWLICCSGWAIFGLNSVAAASCCCRLPAAAAAAFPLLLLAHLRPQFSIGAPMGHSNTELRPIMGWLICCSGWPIFGLNSVLGRLGRSCTELKPIMGSFALLQLVAHLWLQFNTGAPVGRSNTESRPIMGVVFSVGAPLGHSSTESRPIMGR